MLKSLFPEIRALCYMWRANQILGNWFITKYFAQKTLLGENSTLENDFNIDYPMVDSSKDSKILRY